MKKEVDGLKRRVDGVEATTRAIFESLGRIEAELSDLGDIRATVRRTALVVAETRADVNGLKDYVHEKCVTRGEFNDRMDGLAGRIDDFAYHMAKQKERIDDLEAGRRQS